MPLLAQGLRGRSDRPRAMVAYNLLLSIFPLALIALFVAGPRAALARSWQRSVIDDARSDLPDRRAEHAGRGRPAAAAVLDHGRHRRRWSPRCGSAPPSGARWTPRSAASTTCRAARGCARSCSASGCSFVVLLFIAASVAVPTVQALAVSGAERPAVRPRRRPRPRLLRRDRGRPAGPLRRAVHHLRGGAEGRDPVALRVAGRARRDARDGRRRRDVPAVPARTSRPCGSGRARLRADRARLVLRAGADRARAAR